MAKDYVYSNAPLVEVIAEIGWSLKKIDVVPDAMLDPYYDLFREQYLEQSNKVGLSEVRELIPDIVPIELTPGQPRIQLRSKSGNWPLVQIGPGLLTANIVPPYEGWAAFEEFLYESVGRLFSAYPISERTLRIDRLHLRYIDSFDEKFGFNDFATFPEFAKDKLGINVTLPEPVIASTIMQGAPITYVLEYRFSNKCPAGSSGRLKIAPGQIDSRNSLIMELQCESRFGNGSATDLAVIKHWFFEAHTCLRSQFEMLTTEALERLMGDKRDV